MPQRSSFAISILTAMVLLGSLLSFGMEPLIGRLVVPYYGGSVHVWTTSMMTFQGLLLLGYAYAHLVAPRLGPAHLLVLLLPLLQWPLAFSSPVAPEAPIATLVVALLRSMALPFAALTTTAVVAQSWWAGSRLAERGEPWWLYGASNLGSLSALIGYPLVVEPFVGLSVQARGWSWLYLLYVALAACAWLSLRPATGVVRAAPGATSRPPHVGYWLALSAAPSVLLLGLTNQVAHEIGSFPLVWVVPLALYLGSFIVAFKDREGALVRASRHWVLLVAAQILAFAAFRGQASLVVLLVSLVPFLLLCVASHRLLYELRPDVAHLTSFYLWVALGGWIGGTLVTLGAPTLLPGLYEPFLACAGVALAIGAAAPVAANARWSPWAKDIALRNRYAVYGAILLVVAMVDRSGILHDHVLAWHRNFYGTYRIEDVAATDGVPSFRRMVHGGTLHGSEMLDTEPGRPGAYFYPDSPLSQVVAASTGRPTSIAIVGLGAGAMAWSVRAGDSLAYYEIDGENEALARRWFTFLDKAKAPVQVHVGDARLSMRMENERHAPQYDRIIIDAFSGDSIPLHLATREAWDVYLQRLAADGILAMHVSNRYYDVRPNLARLAAQTHLFGVCAEGSGGQSGKGYPGIDLPSEAVAFSRNEAELAPLLAKGWNPIGTCVTAMPAYAWTDDFASVLTALR